MKTFPHWLVTALVAFGVGACGSKSDDGGSDSGLAVPDATLTDADMAPGTLKALDAAKVKARMEAGGEGNYEDEGAPEKEDEGEASCTDKLFDALKVEAKDDTLRLVADVDFGPCTLESLKEEEDYKTADFSKFKVSIKNYFATWIQCEGQDLAAYDGKVFSAIKDIPECDKAGTVKVWSESASTTDMSGEITGAKNGDTTYDVVFVEKSVDRSTQRTADGEPCSASLDAGVFTYEDDCIWTSRSVATEKKSGIKGEEEVDEDVGKEDYEQLKSVGLKQSANSTAYWYAGGEFAVVFHDWAGTVKYSSPTAEPVFEMKKGSESVTGTIKAEKADGLLGLLRRGR
jgi:hypothetical protein